MKINYKKIAIASTLTTVSLLVLTGLVQAAAFSEQASLGISYLKIPTINVDALIEPMGITQGGAMEAPSGSKNVGWYIFGSLPGDNGTAVIDGHYGHWKNGDVSVFDDLNKLIAGDKIYVENKNGVVSTFVVRELRIYNPEDDASDVFSSSDRGSHLNIIACAGTWDGIKKTYSNRLVVFADKE